MPCVRLSYCVSIKCFNTPVGLPSITPTRKRYPQRVITTPSKITLDFMKLKKDKKIKAKRQFPDICVTVINSKDKSCMTRCLLVLFYNVTTSWLAEVILICIVIL